MRRGRFGIAAWACALVLLTAIPAVAGDLESQLRQMIRGHDLRQTQVSAVVMDLSSDEVLAAINADEPMIPASNMKLLTTAAALDVLGADFTFRTELSLIEGAAPTLVIRGDGDPAFGDPDLLKANGLAVDELINEWVRQVVATGQKRIARLTVDDRVFDRDFVHRSWPEGQLIRAYCAQVAGLNFYGNCIDVLMIPGERQGVAPQVDLFPASPFLQTVNEATTGKNDAYWVQRDPGTNRFTFRGSVKSRPYGPLKVTVHDPSLFFGEVLAHRLGEAGVVVEKVDRPANDERLASGRVLHVVQTVLPVVIARTNQDSENMFAEALLKRMGRAVTGAPGSWENGSAALRLALRNRLGPRSSVVEIDDGSGMSRDNRVTARLLVDVLASMHHDEDSEKALAYRQSLAMAGVSGTLDDRLKGLAGQVFAKSGYIREVSALSGYLVVPPEVAGAEPRVVAFSFLFNGFQPPLHNHQMKALQDKLVRAVERSVRADLATNLGG